jgi:Host cell surface-exposed lipoprotein
LGRALNYSSFSRSGLIAQLKFEGFTAQQAEYGVNTNRPLRGVAYNSEEWHTPQENRRSCALVC